MIYINHIVAFLSLVFYLTGSISAQIPAPKQTDPIAITGGTFFTVSGDVIEDGIIVFEDGTITAIGSDVAIPDGAQIFDASGKHIYPGLIDAYSNMGLTEIGAVNVTSDFNEYGDVTPNVRAERAFHPESEHIPVARSHGIAVAISSPGGNRISGLSAAMMMDGWTWEGMTLRPKTGLMIDWPSMSDNDNAQKELQLIKDTFAKARAYHTARSVSDQYRTDMRWEAMIPVLQKEVPVVVSADDSRQIQSAITWAESEDVRLIILGGRDAHFVTDQLVAKAIPVLLTSVLASPGRQWQSYDEVYSHAGQLQAAGIRIAIAGGYGSANAMRLRHHAATASGFGLSKNEAIKAMTIYPAEFFGLDDKIGSLEEGKDATLMITDGDILDLRTSVEQLFIQGRKIDMADKQKNLFERYQEKYRQLSNE